MKSGLLPWAVVYQQTQRWLKAGVFESMAHDLRAILRLADGRANQPTAAIMASRTLQSTPQSGRRSGYDGAKRRKGSNDARDKMYLEPLTELELRRALLALERLKSIGPVEGVMDVWRIIEDHGRQ